MWKESVFRKKGVLRLSKYKIAIVDDEQDVRERLESMILKSPTAFELVGVFDNGIDAYEGITGKDIDLLITDIRIPYIDGIELSRKLKSSDPFIKIIIITGYDQFDYAKQAIELEVIGFISKPILQKELDKALQKAHARISTDYNVSSVIQELSEFRKENLPVLVENDLCLLLQMDKPEASFIDKLKKEGVHLRFDHLCIGVFDFDVRDDKTDFDKLDLAFLTLKNQLEQAFKKYDFELFKRSQLFVLILKSLQPFSNVEILKFLDTEIKRIKRYLNLSMSVGISNPFTIEGSFKKHFRDARASLEQRRFLGSNQVFFCSDLAQKENLMILDRDAFKNLSYVIRYEGLKEIKKELDYLFEIAKDGVYHYTLTEVLNTIISNCEEPEKLIKDGINLNQIHLNLLEHKTKESVYNYFIELILAVKGVNQSLQTDVVGKNLDKILKYIETNFSDQNLNLEMASDQIGLSPSYISALLKNEKNTTFVKYVTQLRMEKAKELLKKQSLKIIEVAEMVGYYEPYYFSHCFKKYEGKSPKEFKKDESWDKNIPLPQSF